MNPIYASDLFENDGAIKSFVDDLAKLRGEASLTKKQAQQLETAIRGMTGATEEQQEVIEQQLKDAKSLNTAYKRYQDSMSDTSLAIAKLREETNENNRITKLTIKLNAAEKGSYDNLSAQYSILKIKLNKMGAATKEAAAEKAKLEMRAKGLYEEMKKLQEATGKNTLNVGNYASALEGLGGPIGGAIKGVNGLGAQFAALLRNPVVLFLAAIVGALVALGKAFMKSERAAALMAKASGYLEGIMSALVDISVKLADGLVSAFENPKESLKSLGQMILGQVFNRIKAVIDIVMVAGRALKALWDQDTSAMQQAFRDANTAIVQMVTGLDKIQQTGLAEYLDETTKKVEDQANAFAALAARKREIAKLNTQLTKQAERLRTDEEIYQQAADDTTLSLKAQAAALEQALEVGQRRIKLEMQISQNNLSLLNEEIALRRANGEDVLSLLEQQASGVVAVESAERELALFRANADRQRREIARDAFERELDFAIDLFDAEKMRLERTAANAENDLSIRTAALAKIIELDRSSFKEQIKLTEEFSGERINLAELALIEDEKIVRERLRLMEIDDIVMGRILEILRERKMATQDIMELEQQLSKERAENGVVDLDVLSGANRKLEQQLALRENLAMMVAKRITTPVDDQQQKSIFERLGITVTDKEKDALASATAFAIEQIEQLAQAKVDAANRAVAASDREVDSAQANLDNTISLAQLGYAVNVENAQNELELAEAKQRENVKIQQRAEREQRAIQTLQQATNLATAAAKILAEVPFPANLFAVGTMFGTFAFAKLRARRLSREFRKGGYRVLDGQVHEAGGNYEGTDSDGVDEYSEAGEGRAFFTRGAVRKYGAALPDLVKRINNLKFKEHTQSVHDIVQPFLFSTVTERYNDANNAGVENRLDGIKKALDKPTFVSNGGEVTEIYKNRTRTYVK